MKPNHVSLVVDEDFGAKVFELSAFGPIWLIRSPGNKRAMDSLRASFAHPPDSLTIFDRGGPTPEEAVLAILHTVDEHHPAWLTLDVIGAPPSDELKTAFLEYGRGVIKETSRGFTFSREQPTA